MGSPALGDSPRPRFMPTEIVLRHPEPDPAALVRSDSIQADQNPAVVYLSRLAPRSRRVMRQSLDAIAGIVTGGAASAETIPWRDLRYQHTAAIRAALAARYAPATANRGLSALRGVLKETWRLGQMTAEAYQRAADLKNVRGTRLPAGRALAGMEVVRLFESCDADEIAARGSRDAALLAVLYGAGVRRNEAATLLLGDYDADTETLRVRGKGDKERLCPLAEGGAARIESWLLLRGRLPGALLCPVNKAGRITLRVMSGQAVWGIILRRAKDAGVEAFSPHDARRTFISDLLDAGADLSAVQQLAGHASPITTARYDRRGERAKKKAVSLLRVPAHTLNHTDP